ncbi:hypothetical protein ACFYM5_36750, partial [Streptomyces sp. NPDC006706]
MSDHDPQQERLVDEVKAGPGGAMTDEVGVITGELTVATSLLPDGRTSTAIQYTEADEWYTLTGSPAPVPPEGMAAPVTFLVAPKRGAWPPGPVWLSAPCRRDDLGG